MEPTTVEWAIFMRDGFRCRRCKRRRNSGAGLVADPIVPASYGGQANGPANLQTLCQQCTEARALADYGRLEDPDHPEALQRVLSFSGLKEAVLGLFREAVLAKEQHGTRYRSLRVFEALDHAASWLVGRTACLPPDLAPADEQFLRSSGAYDAVVKNLWNLLPADR